MNRAVSFEYMNRQLVWNEFSVLVPLFIKFICTYFVEADGLLHETFHLFTS